MGLSSLISSLSEEQKLLAAISLLKTVLFYLGLRPINHKYCNNVDHESTAIEVNEEAAPVTSHVGSPRKHPFLPTNLEVGTVERRGVQIQ